MNSLRIQVIGAEQEDSIKEEYRAALGAEAAQKIVDCIVEKSEDVSLVSNITGQTSEGRYYKRWFLDIGASDLYMYIECRTYTASANYVYMQHGICKKSDIDTRGYVYELGMNNCTVAEEKKTVDGVRYYWGVIDTGFHYVTENGVMTAFFTLATEATSASIHTVFDKDNFNKKYMWFVNETNSSYDALYYLDDETNTKYNVERQTTNCGLENHVLKEKAKIKLNGNVVALTDKLVNMYNTTLGTSASGNGMQIMVDGVKYVKLDYAYWMPTD